MSEDDQDILEDEPLKVLQLFRKREIHLFAIDEIKYKKLYDAFSCTICRQLFHQPVYLKCSHRFCRECIEKYIRMNGKKSCPNCRGGLSTRRDLKEDFCTSSMISYAFGNAKKFSASVNQVINSQIKILQNKSKSKSDTLQEGKIGRKKIKVNQEIQSKSKSKQTYKQQKIVKLEEQKEYKSEIVEQPKQQNMTLKPIIESIKKSNKKKKKQIIQISSESDNNNKKQKKLFQTPKKKNKIQKDDNNQIDKNEINNNKDQIKYSTQQKKSQQKQITVRKKSIQKDNYVNYQEDQKQKYFQNLPKNVQVLCQTRDNELVQACNTLENQLGSNYLQVIMKQQKYKCMIPLKLRPLHEQFLTPPLKCECINFPVYYSLRHLKQFIALNLNSTLEDVDIYIAQEDYFKKIKKDIKIYEINEQYWKNNIKGIQPFDMNDLLKELESDYSETELRFQRKQVWRKLYYKININQQK